MPLTNFDIEDWLHDHPRSDKEKTEIRKKIAAAIAPILDQQGFVKISTTFLRLHGDGLLQSVSVCYRAHQEPSLQLRVNPLYNFDTPWRYYFQGIRSHCGLEGEMIGTVAGRIIQPCDNKNDPSDNNSYLAYQTDIDAALVKEIELLETDTIPRLNRMITVLDSILLVYPDKPVYPTSKAAIAYICRKEYAKAADVYEKQLIPIRKRLDELYQIKAMPKEKRTIYVWALTEEDLQKTIQNREKDMKSVLSKIAMLRENRINDFCPLMNASMDTAYAYLGKISKRFVQKYSCPSYFANIM